MPLSSPTWRSARPWGPQRAVAVLALAAGTGLLLGCLGSSEKVEVTTSASPLPLELAVVLRVSLSGVVAETASRDRIWFVRRRERGGAELGSVTPNGALRRLASRGVGGAPQAIAWAFGSIWIANGLGDSLARPALLGNTVTKVDPVHGLLKASFRVRDPSLLARSARRLWVIAADRIYSIEPRSHRLSVVLRVPRGARSLAGAGTREGLLLATTSATRQLDVRLIRDDLSIVRVASTTGGQVSSVDAHASRVWLALENRVIQVSLSDPGHVISSGVFKLPGQVLALPANRALVLGRDGTVWHLNSVGDRINTALVGDVGDSADAVYEAGANFFVWDSTAGQLTLFRWAKQ
jgi:hypothetical protein